MTALRTVEIRIDDRMPVGFLARFIDGPALVVDAFRKGDGVTVVTDRETPKLYGGMSTERWHCGAWNAKATAIVYGPPPASWCDSCGHDTAPDQYGRVSPYAVFGTLNGRSITAARNLHHDQAHEYAARLVDDQGWTRAEVGIDSCG